MSLAKAMARLATSSGRNHDVRVVLNNRFAESVEAVAHEFDGVLARDHFRVFDVPPGIAAASARSAWRIRAAERIREEFIAELSPDVVHVASLFEGWADDAATSVAQGRAFGGATTATLYDLIPLMRKDTYLADPDMRQWYYRKLQGLKSADLLLAISDYTRKEALSELQLYGEQIINISAAIDDVFRPVELSAESSDRLKSQYGITRSFLMYTGGIDPRKNIEGLIEAFARLPDNDKRAHQLAIVCSARDDDQRRLRMLAQRAGLKDDTLIMTGYVSEADLVALYNSATAFVFPSLHEGFGLPVLEAMACGVPVVGSNTSSIPEVLNYADALFDPTNLDAMAHKIHQVLADSDMRNALREHGLMQARRFSWDESARRALEGFEALHERQAQTRVALMRSDAAVGDAPTVPTTTPMRWRESRPVLAYLSPLPPDRSGIADYSVEVLMELARYYDITVVTKSPVDDPWVQANCHVRPIAWFESHADDYDRIVYHFGNSEFHDYMFGLLTRFPGVVVLHDFFMSSIVDYLDGVARVPTALTAALYRSHGYPALIDYQENGRLASIWKYPCNRQVLDEAMGIIVHSEYSKHLANEWYGPGLSDDWTVIPLIRALSQSDRNAARARLGLHEGDYLTCAFGKMGKTKLNKELLDAWLASPMASDRRCRLVFVGEADSNPYGVSLDQAMQASGCGDRIKITGFASRQLYLDYLAAADCAVQLRTLSRGETSASILDCLAHGIPTIVNANGSAGELPDDVLWKMPDSFSQQMLVDAVTRMRDVGAASEISVRAKDFIRKVHHPFQVGKLYRDTIERLSASSPLAQRSRLLSWLARIDDAAAPDTEDIVEVARSMSFNEATQSVPRQLLVDVSELVQRDAKSGIQRVVRNVLHVLLREPPMGYRVEPVYERDGRYRYARQFTCGMLDVEHAMLEDEEIELRSGDRFLGLDLYPDGIARNERLFHEFRNRGVEVYFVVYDLLPILRPDTFVGNADVHFGNWLKAIARISDGLICISRAVADELCAWMSREETGRATPLRVGYFHLGADLWVAASPVASQVVDETEEQKSAVLVQVRARPTLLMVGTVERRKAHAQALAALELLWAQGIEVNLVIVGKQGWMADELIKTLRHHTENGKRLFWLEKASDSLLMELYDCASGLLVTSEGEGFGLPLIEAAQQGLPIVARDLPVFREVAGEHAFYFSGTSAESLAQTLSDWLQLLSRNEIPHSSAMPWRTWAQSVEMLLAVVWTGHWYRTVPIDSSSDE
jgi:glycosyltransferase involved in cell wall biosynthesis